jgi:amidase
MQRTTTAPRGTSIDPSRISEDDDELMTAFWAYERAFLAGDAAAVGTFFADTEDVFRVEGASLAVGGPDIARQRAAGGLRPPRRIVRVHLARLSPADAVLTAETATGDGGAGVQTQIWHREERWRIAAAHVSRRAAQTLDEPLPGIDPFRLRLDTPPAGRGDLSGVRVAVKDLFAVAGHRVGAGVPAWLDTAEIETRSADAVQALMDAGATLAGIAHTDELAFGLGGDNAHYGTPANPAAPGTLPGGSSSGSASAVALGLADLGLGTDTAGSIRVPGSYCGLFGLRATTGAVSLRGALALAPTFDAAGLIARDLDLLERAFAALHPGAPEAAPPRILVDPSLFALADSGICASLTAALRAARPRLDADLEPIAAPLAPDATAAWFSAFRTVQMHEAWTERGRFIAQHPDALSPDVDARFREGSMIEAADVVRARAQLSHARAVLDRLVPTDAVLVLPTTATAAPVASDAEAVSDARGRTLPLTAIASWSGRPALSVPLGAHLGRPSGLSIIGPPHGERTLLRLARLLMSTGRTT